MSADKTKISQIDAYLKGKLDNGEMHRLEREAFDDDFLTEALEGYEELPADAHAETLVGLKEELYKRANPPKKRAAILWRYLPIAASVLLMLGAGYWFLKPDAVQSRYTKEKQQDSVPQIADNKATTDVTAQPEKKVSTADQNTEPVKPKGLNKASHNLTAVEIAGNHAVVYKTDTVEYIASNYKVRNNANVDEMLKKAEGFAVDTNGSVTYQGQQVTKARLNGKDYAEGDVAKAVQNLPADIVDKFQVVDDYGDQAGRTGVKSGDATKVLNLTTKRKRQLDTISKPLLINEVTILNVPQPVYKTDTVVYTAGKYRARQNQPIDDILKRAEGFEVSPNGEITFQGQYIKKVKLNGENQGIGDITIVTKNLPADVVDKFEVIDDYSDAAKNTFKNPGPEKVLNFNISSQGNTIKRNTFGYPTNADEIANIPAPVNGWNAYQKYLDKNAIAKNTTGVVVLGFEVVPTGKISGIKILIGANGPINSKAISLVKNGPKWRGTSTAKEVCLTIVFRNRQ